MSSACDQPRVLSTTAVRVFERLQRKRKAEEASAAIVPSRVELTEQQLALMKENREEAEQRRVCLRLAQPAHGQQRPGANGTYYNYQTIDEMLRLVNGIIGPANWSHEIYDESYKNRVMEDGRIDHLATAKCRARVTVGSKTTTHEATGTSRLVTKADDTFIGEANSRKAAESDAVKRCLRFLGETFSTTPSPGPAQ